MNAREHYEQGELYLSDAEDTKDASLASATAAIAQAHFAAARAASTMESQVAIVERVANVETYAGNAVNTNASGEVEFCNWCPNPHQPDWDAHPNGQLAHLAGKVVPRT